MNTILAQAALRAPHEVALQCVAGLCYYHRMVRLSSSSLSVFCFWPTSGNLPCAKICFPQYFGITRRYMPKMKIFFLGNFYFLRKKQIFEHFFSVHAVFLVPLPHLRKATIYGCFLLILAVLRPLFYCCQNCTPRLSVSQNYQPKQLYGQFWLHPVVKQVGCDVCLAINL